MLERFPVSTLMRTRGLGLVARDEADVRDRGIDELALGTPATDEFSLEKYAGPVLNQLGTNSCVLNAILDAECTTMAARYGLKVELGSRLAGYYNARRMRMRHPVDIGCGMRDAIKVSQQFGIVDEVAWPFDPWKVNVHPDVGIYLGSYPRRGLKRYNRVFENADERILAIRSAIHDRFAVAFGIGVWQEFVTDDGPDHIVYDPKRILGGHCMELLGYKHQDAQWWFRMKQSYGAGYRDSGYAWLSEEFVVNAWDTWIIDPSGPR
jgi:hypothetical protein